MRWLWSAVIPLVVAKAYAQPRSLMIRAHERDVNLAIVEVG